MTEASLNDAALIEHTLELAAQRHEDISPLVYAHFFASCPEAAPLFKVIDPTQPPHGCGQMLFEILSLLQDCAAQKAYVAHYMQQIASNHYAFGVQAKALYAHFLNSVVCVLADTLDKDWNNELEVAWCRQTRALLTYIPS